MSEVEKLLTDKDIYFVPKGKDVLVRCFNPEHDDSNPSMRIDREDGKYHCFSCGYKGNVFDDFKVVRNRLTAKTKNLLEQIEMLRKASGVATPTDAFSYEKSFRGISSETICKFEAFESESEFEGRICFPIKDSVGNTLAFIGRYKESNAKPKYMIKPRKVALPFFPPASMLQPIRSSIILVEGIFDMLNCYDKGLTNVACIFGADQVGKDVLDKLSPYIMTGVDTVYIMYDADDAGRSAALKAKNAIKHNTTLLVEILELQDGMDPGDLSYDDVQAIKDYLLNK